MASNSHSTTVSTIQDVYVDMSTKLIKDHDPLTDKMCIGTRKRTLSSTDDVEPKKIHSTIDNELKNISPADLPKKAESELFMFSAIQNLANNISLSFNMMNIRMNQLERNIKEKISTKIQTALKTQIQEEVFKVKDEIKQDIHVMNTKIEDVQKSYESLSKEKNSKTTTDVRNNIMIRNLRYDELEKDNSEVTTILYSLCSGTVTVCPILTFKV
jgi:hypothetical protein